MLFYLTLFRQKGLAKCGNVVNFGLFSSKICYVKIYFKSLVDAITYLSPSPFTFLPVCSLQHQQELQKKVF